MSKYKIGDVVYTAGSVWRADPIPCPVCGGTGYALVKPFGGDDSAGTKCECNYCNHSGFGIGVVADMWLFKPCVTEIHIQGMETTTKPGKTETRYLFNTTSCSHSSVMEDQLYPSRADAEAAADAMTLEANRDADQRRIESIVHSREGLSWDAGYHKKELKEAERRAEYHARALGIKAAERQKKGKGSK